MKPPYEVSETGWGEFEIIIKIYFVDPTERPVSTYWLIILLISVASLFVCLLVCLFTCLFTSLQHCLFVCLLVYLFVSLLVFSLRCNTVCLFVC